MHSFIRTIIITIAVLCAGQVSAQKYVVDPFMADSVPVSEIVKIEGKQAVGVEAYRIAKGDTVNVISGLENWSNHGVIKGPDGKKYAIRVKACLMFIDNEDVEDPWETMTADWRTPDGRLYSTMTPYYWIIGLVIGALILTMIGFVAKPIKVLALIFVPIMIALACYLEIRGWLALGSDMFWWCDNETFGFWGSVLRVMPFGLVILGQLFSFPFYGKLISEEGTSLAELAPMAISMLVSIPILFIVGLVLGICHVKGGTVNLILEILFLVIVGIGSLSTIAMNIKSYGFFKGLWLTIFGAIYIVGAMIAVLGFAIALWHLFVQMVMAMLPWLIGIFLLLPGGKASDNTKKKDEKHDSFSDFLMGTDSETVERQRREERRRHGLPE